MLGSSNDISTWDVLKEQKVVKALVSIPEMQEEIICNQVLEITD